MKGGVNRETSIYIRLAKLLIAAAAIASVAFFLMSNAIEKQVDAYYSNTDYVRQKDEEYIWQLQRYIDENRLKTTDTVMLTEWIRRQKILTIKVYKDGILCYDSEYPEEEAILEGRVEEGYYDWGTYYLVKFADRECYVSIYGSYAYQFYSYATIMELLLAFLLFLGIVMLGIRKTLRYIRTLSGEIELLEGGNLDYAITIEGKDELAALAEGLEQMRRSFKYNMEQETHLVQANKRMITEMSHDLRTPLTSMMIYTEILKKGKYKDEEQLREYIEKIDQKAHRLKQLSDHIFEYSLITEGTDVRLKESDGMEAVFYDLLSETCAYLEQQGYQVQMEFEWREVRIWIHTEYLMRIMDNITSNLLKYADTEEAVVISSVYMEDYAGFSVANKKRLLTGKPDSTKIGIPNMKNMLSRIGGYCSVEQDEVNFKISLLFLKNKNAASRGD